MGLLSFFACQICAQTKRDNTVIPEESLTTTGWLARFVEGQDCPLTESQWYLSATRRMCAEPAHPIRDKEIDCLLGFINTVHSEIVALVKRGGTYVNGQTTQIKDITHDRQGNTVERIVYGFDFLCRRRVSTGTIGAETESRKPSRKRTVKFAQC